MTFKCNFIIWDKVLLTLFFLLTFSSTFTLAETSQEASLKYLKAVMDQYHDRFPLYDDVSSAGNHFHAWAKIPDQHAPVTISGTATNNPHSGATAIRCEFVVTNTGAIGGFYLLNGTLPPTATAPVLNFGAVPNAGVDLTGATRLIFWARGQQGGEQIEFFMGGVGRDPMTGNPTTSFPGSTPVVKQSVTLTSTWQQYEIDVANHDLSYVLGGFGWIANAQKNPRGAVFFLDDIQYELNSSRREQRLNEPRFLRSFTTEPHQPALGAFDDFDFVLRNLAFSYDNATVLLAFLADGSPDSIRRAKLIGDAFVYASQHDRHPNFRDSQGEIARIRTAYMAGDLTLPPGWIPNNFIGTVPIPGIFLEDQQRFIEVEQKSVDVGNNSWVMIALLALHQTTGESIYLETAKRLGEFILTFQNTNGKFKGFQGGMDDPESNNPIPRPWASTEHNLDVFAGFSTLFQLTREPKWHEAALHARAFIDQMYDPQAGCFFAGTINPNMRNEQSGQLPLDTQSWSVLALKDASNLYAQILTCAEQNHHTIHDGFEGFDFNDDQDGVWFEGTAQMAVAYDIAGQTVSGSNLREELRRAQATHFPGEGTGQGIVAASHSGVTSGFGFQLLQRLHIAATAWNMFAESEFNPFYDTAQGRKGKITSPMAGLLITENAVTFEWNPGQGATQYWMGIGTSLESVSTKPWGNLYAQSQGTKTTAQVTNIPLTGDPIYVRLWTKINGRWLYEDYTYLTEKSTPHAQMQVPRPSTTLTSSTVTFHWTQGFEVTQYWLGIGTSLESVSTKPWGNLYAQSQGTKTTTQITSIPLTGDPIYVRLWTKINGRWLYKDYTYETTF
ncbi:MAG: hypothetical protein NPIRA02_06970 [Nitrospirales bacterium]|nr:MAG: hypothetical protein NPIRA02_06970 [Nitrospirales bacterium]